MSAPGSQFAGVRLDAVPQGRSPMAHLMHALNQPLTGLQCLLELAVAGPRNSDQSFRALREGLELTARMRVLVEAIRELTETEQQEPGAMELVALDGLMRETAGDLRPVAETKHVQLAIEADASLPVRACRRTIATLAFRFLESALSLAEAGSVLRIATQRQQQEGRVVVSWNPEKQAPPYSPFSRPELGLLIAAAGWAAAGADWSSANAENLYTVTIRLSLSSPEGTSPKY